MKLTFIIVLFTTISLSASAQFLGISLKKHERFPQLTLLKNNSTAKLPAARFSQSTICPLNLSQSDYSLELAEATMMRTAQHNMRFRIYDVASYNFSDLAELYIKQNRFSEAKWFFLQSNMISRQQNDDKHTITNLMGLAMVKANMGDLAQAQQDLAEAREIAHARGWLANIAEIEKESKKLQNIISIPRTELRYAADAMVSDKKTD